MLITMEKTEMNEKQTTLQDVIDYLEDASASFELDPADTEFQRGYEQAVRDMMIDLVGRPPVWWLH
jgi:hypothetical protein